MQWEGRVTQKIRAHLSREKKPVCHARRVGKCPQYPASAVSSAVEPDEPHIAAAKEVNRTLKTALYNTGLRSPFL